MFYETAYLKFDWNGECHDKKAINKGWIDICRYPKDERTAIIDGTTYLYCVTLTRNTLASHFWAVYPGQDNPKKAQYEVPAYLTLKNPNQKEDK